MESRVIMIEGLPGTGKSTNSYKLMMQLERNGYKVKWFHEVTRPHPTLFFSEAGFTYGEYEAFCKTHPEAAHILDSIAVYRKNTIGIDLLEVEWNYVSAIGDSAFQALKSFDVLTFSHDKYVDFALEKWVHFSETALLENNVVYIFDSSIFQYQIFEFLLKTLLMKIWKDLFISSLILSSG